MLYLVMGNRTPISQDYFPWLHQFVLEDALTNRDIIPDRFFDETIIKNFLDAFYALTPKPELSIRKQNGYVDYIFDTDHPPAIFTCMIYQDKEKFDRYYDPRADLYDNFRTTRGHLLNLFNLKIELKNCSMPNLYPSDIPDTDFWEIFHDPNIPNELDEGL